MRQKTPVSLRPSRPVEGDHTPIVPVDRHASWRLSERRRVAAPRPGVLIAWSAACFGLPISLIPDPGPGIDADPGFAVWRPA